MNKKGEVDNLKYIGLLVGIAVVLIVGAIFLQASAQNVGQVTNTVNLANQSLSSKVVNGTAQYITNCRALSDVVVYNETGAAILVGSGNYTITNNVIKDGALSVEVLPEASAPYKSIWKVSGVCQPLTYDDNAGGRSIATLIVLMFALAIGVIALVPALRSGVLDMLGK